MMSGCEFFDKLEEYYMLEPRYRTIIIDTINKYNDGHKDLTNTSVRISFMSHGIHGRTIIIKINGDNFRPLAITLMAKELGLKIINHVLVKREIIQSYYYNPCSKHIIELGVKKE